MKIPFIYRKLYVYLQRLLALIILITVSPLAFLIVFSLIIGIGVIAIGSYPFEKDFIKSVSGN